MRDSAYADDLNEIMDRNELIAQDRLDRERRRLAALDYRDPEYDYYEDSFDENDFE